MADDGRRSARVLAGVLLVTGVAHFVVPSVYERIVPRPLGHARGIVLLSGAAELACAGLLVIPRTRRIGGWCTAALLVGVFPANVQMALDGTWSPVVAWLRLPLEVPLAAWAVSVARRPVAGVASS